MIGAPQKRSALFMISLHSTSSTLPLEPHDFWFRVWGEGVMVSKSKSTHTSSSLGFGVIKVQKRKNQMEKETEHEMQARR